MIRMQGPLPRKLTVACSGGVDSMSIVDFLSRSHDVTVAYFDHGTDHGREALNFLLDKFGSSLIRGSITRAKEPSESWEEFWRNERYEFLHSIDEPVVTGHHLDDCVETWVMSCMHGTGKWIPYRNKNVIRPFRLTKKSVFREWSLSKKVPYIEDQSNSDINYTRNYIRHEMMPHVLKVNPGIHKTIAKKMENDYDRE